MALPYSIDDVMRTSDDAAVRAHFDLRTLAFLRIMTPVSLLMMLMLLLVALGHGQFGKGALALAGFLLAVIMTFSIRRGSAHRFALFVEQRTRGVTIGFVLAETAALLLFSAPTNAVAVFSAMIPCALVFCRLLPAEHVLLHGGVAAVSLLTLSTFRLLETSVEVVLIPPLMFNAMALMLALFVSRRVRRNVLAQWSERRTSAREQIRMRDELRYARDLQLSMLPDSAPNIGFAELAALSLPATEVGGDYFDYFVEQDQVAIVCGDVAGHGMASGIVLSAVRSGFTLLRDQLHDPAAVLGQLHDLVMRTSRRRMLVTVSVVLIERNGSAIFASAGHPPVLLRRAGGEVETIELFAPPLGVRLPLAIPQRRIQLNSGDVVILHSDGIYETQNAAGESYGFERLAAVVAEHGGTSAEALRDAIVRDVTSFRGALEQADDMTVVVCRMA